jgi:hypothetical protein
MDKFTKFSEFDAKSASAITKECQARNIQPGKLKAESITFLLTSNQGGYNSSRDAGRAERLRKIEEEEAKKPASAKKSESFFFAPNLFVDGNKVEPLSGIIAGLAFSLFPGADDPLNPMNNLNLCSCCASPNFFPFPCGHRMCVTCCDSMSPTLGDVSVCHLCKKKLHEILLVTKTNFINRMKSKRIEPDDILKKTGLTKAKDGLVGETTGLDADVIVEEADENEDTRDTGNDKDDLPEEDLKPSDKYHALLEKDIETFKKKIQALSD